MNRDDEKAWVRAHEGYRPDVYLDSLQKPTVGVGHLITPSSPFAGAQVGDVIADDLLEQQYDKDYIKHEKWAVDTYPNFHRHPSHVQQALINMTYQLGKKPKNWRNFQRALARALETGDYAAAAAEAADSKWYRSQTPKRARSVLDRLAFGTDYAYTEDKEVTGGMPKDDSRYGPRASASNKKRIKQAKEFVPPPVARPAHPMDSVAPPVARPALPTDPGMDFLANVPEQEVQENYLEQAAAMPELIVEEDYLGPAMAMPELVVEEQLEPVAVFQAPESVPLYDDPELDAYHKRNQTGLYGGGEMVGYADGQWTNAMNMGGIVQEYMNNGGDVPKPASHPDNVTDTVPAMLTPGEAVIPKSVAQDPDFAPIIEQMVDEGRRRNDAARSIGMRVDHPVLHAADGALDAKISKLYKEGYDAPGQAYAIAKNMGYSEGTMDVAQQAAMIKRFQAMGASPEEVRSMMANETDNARLIGGIQAAQQNAQFAASQPQVPPPVQQQMPEVPNVQAHPAVQQAQGAAEQMRNHVARNRAAAQAAFGKQGEQEAWDRGLKAGLSDGWVNAARNLDELYAQAGPAPELPPVPAATGTLDQTAPPVPATTGTLDQTDMSGIQNMLVNEGVATPARAYVDEEYYAREQKLKAMEKEKAEQDFNNQKEQYAEVAEANNTRINQLQQTIDNPTTTPWEKVEAEKEQKAIKRAQEDNDTAMQNAQALHDDSALEDASTAINKADQTVTAEVSSPENNQRLQDAVNDPSLDTVTAEGVQAAGSASKEEKKSWLSRLGTAFVEQFGELLSPDLLATAAITYGGAKLLGYDDNVAMKTAYQFYGKQLQQNQTQAADEQKAVAAANADTLKRRRDMADFKEKEIFKAGLADPKAAKDWVKSSRAYNTGVAKDVIGRIDANLPEGGQSNFAASPQRFAAQHSDWLKKNGIQDFQGAEAVDTLEIAMNRANDYARKSGSKVQDIRPWLNAAQISRSTGLGGAVFDTPDGKPMDPQAITKLDGTLRALPGVKNNADAQLRWSKLSQAFSKLPPEKVKEYQRKANKNESPFAVYVREKLAQAQGK